MELVVDLDHLFDLVVGLFGCDQLDQCITAVGKHLGLHL